LSESDPFLVDFLYTICTPENRKKIRDAVKKNKLRISSDSQELIDFLVELTGFDRKKLEEHRRKIAKYVAMAYSGTCNTVKLPPRKQREVGSIPFLTLANSLYIAIYEKHGDKTPQIMYELLEPYIVSCLSTQNREVCDKAQLFFLPVSPKSIDSVLNLLSELLSGKNVCELLDINAIKVLCRKTNTLYEGDGSLSKDEKDAHYCLKKLESILGVCNGKE